MARQRLVKPEFFQHEELHRAELVSALPLRVAYIGLWCQADRRGLFAWRPGRLKLNILPFDTVDFSAVLDALETAGFVRSYVVDGQRFGCIPAFAKHQSFHVRELADKTIPDPPDTSAAPEQPGASTVPTPDENGASTPVTVTVTGTGTGTDNPPRENREDDAKPSGRETWLTPFFDVWTRRVGVITPKRLATHVAPIRAAFGDDATLKGMHAYIDEAAGDPNRPLKIEWFKGDAARWVKEGAEPIVRDGDLTPRGLRLAGVKP